MKDQLTDAAQQTNKAYGAVRKGREGDTGDGSRGGSFQESFKSSSASIGNYLAPEITTMQPILRFLQLLCENHNSDMQVRTHFVASVKAVAGRDKQRMNNVASMLKNISHFLSVELLAKAGPQEQLQLDCRNACLPRLHMWKHNRWSGTPWLIYKRAQCCFD